MKSIDQIRQILKEFNKNRINYCVLRNYEFLLDKKPGLNDLSGVDTVVSSRDMAKIDGIFRKYGFIRRPKAFSLKHQGYAKYISEDMHGIGFDLQIDGVHWNDMKYLDADDIFKHKVKIDGFFVPGKEDSFIMFLVHSILGKRYFKEKYKRILSGLAKDKSLNWQYIKNYLARIFNRRIALELLELANKSKFNEIENKKFNYITYFIIKKPWRVFTLFRVYLSWLIWKDVFTNSPLISFIGPDGAGKSTAVEMLKNVLDKNGRKAEIVYLGRGKANVLPINKTGKAVYEGIKGKSKAIKRIIYTLAAPVYAADLFLRYYFKVWPKRKKRRIIITDRYATDIMLMRHVNLGFKRFLLAFFPKPSITFYLYNDAETLYDRRKQQSIEELEEQMRYFGALKKRLKYVPVKTEDIDKDSKLIMEKTFEWLGMEGY